MNWNISTNVDPLFQNWGEAYKEICAILRAKVPKLKHIDLYYGQEQAIDSDGNWIPFTAPAVFLQFTAAQVDDIGDLRQQLLMDVTVHLAVETVQDTNDRSTGQRRALEFIDIMRQLHVALHNAQGEHFSPMSRVGMAKNDAPPYLYMYNQTYRCVMLDNSTSKQWDLLDPPIALEIEPVSGDPVAPPNSTLVVVRNSDDTYSVEVDASTTDVHTLPNVTHRDSNGAPVTLPAITPFVATACAPCAPARVMTTDGLTEVMTIAAGGQDNLPGAYIAYKTAAGSIDYLLVPNTILVAGRLTPELAAERFRVFLSNGTTQFAAKDITDPTLVLAKVRVQKRDGSQVDYEYTPQPAVIHTESAVPAPVLREYIVSGTWSKPAGLKEVLVYCWGGGGGAGTGRKQAGASTRSGGGSGPGSTLVVRSCDLIPRSVL